MQYSFNLHTLCYHFWENVEIPKSICPIIDSYQKQWIPRQLLAFLPENFQIGCFFTFFRQNHSSLMYKCTIYYKKFKTHKNTLPWWILESVQWIQQWHLDHLLELGVHQIQEWKINWNLELILQLNSNPRVFQKVQIVGPIK